MIKKLIVLLVFICLFSFSVQKNYALNQDTNQITVLLNGKRLFFDVDPYIKNERTLVPFRGILEALRAEVIWNPDEKSVTTKSQAAEIYLKIGETDTLVNGKKVVIDVPAEVTNSRTFVPLRFVSENFGAEVIWDSTTRTISINYKVNYNKIKLLNKTFTYEDSKIIIDKTEFDVENNKFIILGKIEYSGRRITVDVTDTDGYTSPATIKIIGNDNEELKSFEVQKNIGYEGFVASQLDIYVVPENKEKIKIGNIDLLP